MKRVLLAAFIAAAFFLALHRPASAATEFCPGQLRYKAVAPASFASQPQQTYGFEISALTARGIGSATLAFDTSSGWYTVDVPDTELTGKVRHYTGNLSFEERDYVSPQMYVRFPQAVSVNHAWLYSAIATGDGLGWQQQGTVLCPPPPDASSQEKRRFPKRGKGMMLDHADDHLSDPPNATSVVLTAKASKALASTDCPEPFSDATVQDQAAPQYPEAMRGSATSDAAVGVEVAISPDGTVRDTWVRASSGYAAFDTASVAAAKRSTYKGAVSYCQAVPGTYMFDVFFDPNE